MKSLGISFSEPLNSFQPKSGVQGSRIFKSHTDMIPIKTFEGKESDK